MADNSLHWHGGLDAPGLEPGRARHMPVSLLPRLYAWLVQTLDAERGRWFHWLPVLFGAGIGVYFALPFEPPIFLAVAALLAAACLRVFVRKTLFGFLAGSMLLAMACGFAAAKFKSDWMAAPVVQKSFKTSKLEGWAEQWEQMSAKRGRLTLRVRAVEGLSPEAQPFRVRITVNAAAGPRIGQAVSLAAVLMPPSGPAMPGGFDFARIAWFNALGASGFAISPVTVNDDSPESPWTLKALATITNVRVAIAGRIAAALQGSTSQSAIAQALIVGERAQISDQDTQALRASGLFHVISISGLHMTLLAAPLFWLIRLIFSFWPALVLRYPVKKWAAVAAIAGLFGYLLLSGSPVAAVRSFIMIMVMFLAILVDRPAVSLRNVAFSALIILAIYPESLLDPSFQMSYAATAALIAFYERFRGWFPPAAGGWLHRLAAFLAAFIGGVIVTTFVAGMAVAPFSAYHFHNYTSYAVLGNLVGTPIISIVIMPMVFLSLMALPFGLEYWPLQILGAGIDAMLEASRWVESLGGAMLPVPAYPMTALILMVLGGLWLIIWRGRWRVLGGALIAAGLALAPFERRPDILIDREGGIVAVRDAHGRLQAPKGRKGAYSLGEWLEADGDRRKAKEAAKGEGWRCDASSCLATVKGFLVSFAHDASALADDCARAEILIAPFVFADPCPHPKLIIGRRALIENGAHAIYLNGGRIEIETAAAARGDRPWAAGRRLPDIIPAIGPQTDEPSAPPEP